MFCGFWCLVFIRIAFFSRILHSDATLVVTLKSHGNDVNNSLKLISFCVNCPSPEHEGSAAFGLTAKFSLKEYAVTGELIYCIPNFAELSTVLNERQLNNRIALVDRGINGLLEKVTRIESNTGAVGIIIADDGRCNTGYTFCGPRAGSVAEGGFAAFDDEMAWRSVGIPVVLVNLQTAETLRRLMDMKRLTILNAGTHNMTLLRNSRGELEEEGEGDDEDL